MSVIIGIDLGTTNSCVAVVEGGEPKIIVNEEGTRTTPSVVGFTDNDVLVGITARRQAVVNPTATIYSTKRFIGSKLNEVQEAAEKVAFDVVPSETGDAHIKTGDKLWSPSEISAKVLQKLKRAAEKHLGEDVKEAVITVPAYFNDSQRQATKDAGRIAGLDVKRIINEPTAAALAYGLDNEGDQLLAVYDLGGGTFDVSILDVSNSVVEVLSTAGDTYLGGDNIDEAIIDHLLQEFKKDSGLTIGEDPMVMQRIREAAEKAKVELSSVLETEVNLPFLTADATGPKHMQLKLTRSKLEQLTSRLIKKTFTACKRALKDAGKKANEIEQVLLVGGSTRMPLVTQEVEKFFGKKPYQGVNPDEVVALGAAVQGGVLSGDVKDMLLLDVTPLSLGIETLGGVTTRLIERNTTIPTQKTEIFSTATDGQTSVEVHVLQGEREFANDNRTLGQFSLEGITSAPRGTPQIEVSFDLDVNGILKVSAKDKVAGKDQSITITSSAGLNEDEIQQMVKDATKHEAEDKIRRQKIEARNVLDSTLGNAKQMKHAMGDKFNTADIETLDSAISVAESKLEAETLDEITEATNSLNMIVQGLSQAMYEQAQAAQAAQAASPPSENPVSTDDADIIDAEIVDE
jgi:molecular chaperone DnaK